MKQILRITLIAFFSGLAGAYALQFVPFLSTQREASLASGEQIEEPGQVKFVRRDKAKLFEGEINFVEASRVSTQSVVFIKTLSAGRSSDFSLFDFYFGDGLGSRKSIGTGSGVIFTNNGYIVTNYHVIEDAEKIEVIHQKKTYEATIVGKDPSSDLAIIKVEAKNLPSIKRGSARELEIGEWVIAVGNPFNLTSTVTAGIVSAKGRNIGLLGGQFPIESFIQTDAPINPGNSGGALVNIEGELVGINTAILSRTGSYTGYGFAVPVDIVAKIFNDIIQYGQVQKAFTGLEISELDSESDEKYGLKLDSFEGVVVTEVQEGSEADKLGLKQGDVILKINEDKIDGRSAFEELVSYYRPGDQLNITYRRNGQLKTAKITLTNREGTTGVLKNEIYTAERIGGDLEPISKIEKDKLGIESGVRVVKIRRGLLSRLRIQEGFIITSINKEEISTPEEVEQILSSINGRVYIEGIDKNGVRGYYSYYF